MALPECDRSPLEITSISELSEWDNCEGAFIVGPSVSKYAGDTYIGEFRNGHFSGLGVYTSSFGEVREGVWKNDEFLYFW